MTVIAATRPKECTQCRKEVKFVSVTDEGDVIVVLTVCKDCQIEYTSTFRK